MRVSSSNFRRRTSSSLSRTRMPRPGPTSHFPIRSGTRSKNCLSHQRPARADKPASCRGNRPNRGFRVPDAMIPDPTRPGIPLHHPMRVARNTSSTVVSPRHAFAIPISYMLNFPCSWATRAISASDALESRRRWSSESIRRISAIVDRPANPTPSHSAQPRACRRSGGPSASSPRTFCVSSATQ